MLSPRTRVIVRVFLCTCCIPPLPLFPYNSPQAVDATEQLLGKRTGWLSSNKPRGKTGGPRSPGSQQPWMTATARSPLCASVRPLVDLTSLHCGTVLQLWCSLYANHQRNAPLLRTLHDSRGMQTNHLKCWTVGQVSQVETLQPACNQ